MIEKTCKPGILFTYRQMVPAAAGATMLFGGGAQKRVFQLASYLASTGKYRVFLASAEGRDARVVKELEKNGVRHLHIGFNSTLLSPLAACRLNAFLRREKISIVNANDRKSAFVAYLACLFSRTTELVFTARITFSGRKYSSFWMGKHTVAVSEGVKKHQMEYFGQPERQIAVIYNGTDIRPAAPEAIAALRSEIGLPADARVLLSVGRLAKVKGCDLTINALPAILRHHPSTYFVAAGEGPEREALLELAQRLGVADHVKLVGYHDDLAAYYGLADLVLLPSYAEGLPGALLEASLLGKPIVATDIPGCTEVVEPEKTGILIPPGEVAPLADAVIRLLASDDLRKAFGAAAREQAEKKFTLQTMFANYEKYFDRLLPQP